MKIKFIRVLTLVLGFSLLSAAALLTGSSLKTVRAQEVVPQGGLQLPDSSNLLAHFNFDGLDGDSPNVPDVTENGNTGTFYTRGTATYSFIDNGSKGKAMNISSPTGTNAAGFQLDGGFKVDNVAVALDDTTVTADVYFPSLPEAEGTIFARRDLGLSDNRGWTLMAGKTGEMIWLKMYMSNGGTSWVSVATYFPNNETGLNKWYNVAVQFKGNYGYLYIDGVCCGSIVSSQRENPATKLSVGYSISGALGGYSAKFYIDDLKVYNSVKNDDLQESRVPEDGLKLRYSFDAVSVDDIDDLSGDGNKARTFTAIGNAYNASATARLSEGVSSNGIYVNGNQLIPATTQTIDYAGDFTASAFFKPTTAKTGTGSGLEQVIMSRLNYTNDSGGNRREWSLYIAPNHNRLRAEIYVNNAWVRLEGPVVEMGRWYHAAVVVEGDIARLYVNGRDVRMRNVKGRATGSGATFNIGGAMNATAQSRTFTGYIDDVCVYERALTPQEIGAMVQGIVTAPEAETVEIWDSNVEYPMNVTQLPGVEFYSVKMSEPSVDGYGFQHGAAICYYNGKLYATWGRNQNPENNPGEETVCYVSEDDGKTWSFHSNMGTPIDDQAFSHGLLFVDNDNTMWAMNAQFRGLASLYSPNGIYFKDLKTAAYRFDAANDEWVSEGQIFDDFWPLKPPHKMANGNWIMAGCDTSWQAAVAISDGDNMLSWKVVKPDYNWGNYSEATLVDDGEVITMYIRNGAAYNNEKVVLGVTQSFDYGETWTLCQESNMHGTTSKPCAGILSTGERYLINNCVVGANGSRANLTISFTDKGGDKFNSVFLIRSFLVPDALKRTYDSSIDTQALSYPDAYEHDGKLYIIYSASARGGNENNIELAVIDLNVLNDYERVKSFSSDHKDILALSVDSLTLGHKAKLSAAVAALSELAGFEDLLTSQSQKIAALAFKMRCLEDSAAADEVATLIAALTYGDSAAEISKITEAHERYLALTNTQRLLIDFVLREKIELAVRTLIL